MSASQRARMLDAITRAVADKGYARVTVGDVVQTAGVSRRTFYEHFADKEDCFLVAYQTGSDAVIHSLVEAALAAGQDAGWRDVLGAAIDGYLRTLADQPAFARTFLVDVLGAGQSAVEMRSEVYDRFVAQYVTLSRRAAMEDPSLGDVPELHLRALVGGIGELVHEHMLAHDAATLPRLAPALTRLAEAVIEGTGVRAYAA